MSNLGIDNVISISLTSNPSGLSSANIAALALFSNETPNFVDEYKTYLNAKEVEDDFGTASLTAKMAQVIFSQSPNILSARGELIVVPMAHTNATNGSFETADISANVARILAVTDGEFRIKLNDATIDVTGLNFSNAADIDDIATIIKRKLLDCFITAQINSTSGAKTLIFESKKYGADSTIAFSAVPGGAGTDLTGADYLNTAAGSATAGTNSSGEALGTAIARVEDKVYFAGILDTLLIEETAIKAASDAVNARDKVWYHPIFSEQEVVGVGADISAAEEKKTRLILYTDSIEDGQKLCAGYASLLHAVNYNGSATTKSMHLKTITGITADSGINQTVLGKCDAAGIDCYGSIGGLSVVLCSEAAPNDFSDNVVNDLWFKLALQIAGFNYLRTTDTKVIQTEQGINGLKGAYEKVCKLGVANNALGVGLSWNSATTFGNPDDLRRNITDKGYYIYSIPIAQQLQADRNQRRAPLIQIAAKRAGAIHSSNVIVKIEN